MNEIKPVQDDTDDSQQTPTARLQPLTREMLDEHTREVAQSVLPQCMTDETLTLEYGGEVLELRPLDTRRFIMHMSRFISMN